MGGMAQGLFSSDNRHGGIGAGALAVKRHLFNQRLMAGDGLCLDGSDTITLVLGSSHFAFIKHSLIKIGIACFQFFECHNGGLL